MMLYVTNLLTSSFAFVFFPFPFNSYIMKYSFLVATNQPITWQGDKLHILHGFDGFNGGYCFNNHMENIYMIRFLWFVDEMIRRS